LPFIEGVIPPEEHYNFATGEMNNLTEKPFINEEIKYEALTKFIDDNMPDFSVPIYDIDTYNLFMSNKRHNKVILFSQKSKTTKYYKAVASEFRDRVRVR
jgi:hypothetical protein